MIRATACIFVATFCGVMALGFACGPSLSQLQARERCYYAAEAKAQEAVDRECPNSFSTCTLRDSIMSELRADQEACP